MRAKRNGAETGYTLVELMVAVLLMLVVTAGFIPVFLQGLSQSASARYKSTATNIAREKIEQIRQLDYREITTDPSNPRNLTALFGDEVLVPERNMTYLVRYDVADNAMPGQAIKSVQVTVTWDAPPRPSPAVVKTLVAQQYLGPRGAWLEIDNTSPDSSPDPGTPFPLLATAPNGLLNTVKYHIAQSDWFMAYATLSLPLPLPNDISLTSVFRDDAGGKVGTIHLANDRLRSSLDGSSTAVDDIWFEYTIDARTIPDGYWDLQVTMFNKYGEPGNTWDLRVRVEKGAPEAPKNFTATGISDNQIQLSWLPGAERDRARYVLERQKQNPDGLWPTEWTVVEPNLPPNTTSYTDEGIFDTEDPWGSSSQSPPNCYQYRIYGVDKDDRSEPDSPTHSAVSGEVILAPPYLGPLVVVPSVTDQALTSAKESLLTLGLTWSVTEVLDTSHTPGTVLSQNPVGGSQVAPGAAVQLTVARATAPPTILYKVTIATTDNSWQTLTVRDSSNQSVYSGQIKKHQPALLQLGNGNYTCDLGSPVISKSFIVNGQALDVSIP